MLTEQNNPLNRKRPAHRNAKEDKYMGLRNVLNLIFMLGALAGVAVYFMAGHETGTIIILASMLIKIAECVIRFLK